MKRIILSLLVILACKLAVHGQAYAGRLEYQKTQQSVAMIELPYNQDVIEDGIRDYMAKRGNKGSSSKGFTVYRSTRLDDADSITSDLYFKVDSKGRKDKDISIIYLLPTKANQDILARPSADSINLETAKNFLNNMAPYLDAHNTDVQANNQQAILKKAQKKMNDLQDDQLSLEKKIRKLQADQEQNKTDLLKQTADMQSTVSSDDNVKNKAQKKMNKLLDEQDDLRKKLRKTQADLDQNKTDQEKQQQEVQKQQDILDAIKAKQKN